MAISNPFTTNSNDDFGNNLNTDPNTNNTQQAPTDISNNASKSNFNKSSSIVQDVSDSRASSPVQPQQTVTNALNNQNSNSQLNTVDANKNTFTTNVSTNNSNPNPSSSSGNLNISTPQNLQTASQDNAKDNNVSDNITRTSKPDKPATVADLNSKFLSSEDQSNTSTNQMNINNNVTNDDLATTKEDMIQGNQPQNAKFDTELNSFDQEPDTLPDNNARQNLDLRADQTANSLGLNQSEDVLVDSSATIKAENPNTLADTNLLNLSKSQLSNNKENVDQNIHQADKRFMAKMIFLLSLILFLIVAGVVIYVYFI